MVKEFNVTGLCFPEDHYMAEVDDKRIFFVRV